MSRPLSNHLRKIKLSFSCLCEDSLSTTLDWPLVATWVKWGYRERSVTIRYWYRSILKVYCEINVRPHCSALFSKTSVEGIMPIPRCEKVQGYCCTGCVCVWGFCEFTVEIPEACSPAGKICCFCLCKHCLCFSRNSPLRCLSRVWLSTWVFLPTPTPQPCPHIQLKPDSGCVGQMQMFSLHTCSKTCTQ